MMLARAPASYTELQVIWRFSAGRTAWRIPCESAAAVPPSWAPGRWAELYTKVVRTEPPPFVRKIPPPAEFWFRKRAPPEHEDPSNAAQATAKLGEAAETRWWKLPRLAHQPLGPPVDRAILPTLTRHPLVALGPLYSTPIMGLAQLGRDPQAGCTTLLRQATRTTAAVVATIEQATTQPASKSNGDEISDDT